MSGLVLLSVGLLGQWLLGVAAAQTLLRWRGREVPRINRVQQTSEVSETSEVLAGRVAQRTQGQRVLALPSETERLCVEETPWAELAGLGLVLGIGLTAWGLFLWSLCGGMLGRGVSVCLTGIGFAWGGPVIVRRFTSRRVMPNRAGDLKRGSQRLSDGSLVTLEERRDAAWCRLCQWLIGGLAVAAFAQTLLTPQHFWDERSIFAIKGLVLAADGSVQSRDLHDPDFVQYHPRYPLLIPLAEQHVYALLGGVDDRLSKIIFPLLSLGMVLTMAGALSRHVQPGAAWLFALLIVTVPVLMPYELGFLSGQADAPMACFHGLALLYLWDALERAACGADNVPIGSSSRQRWLWLGSAQIGSSIIAGLCGGLAAFTKDEGIAFLLVDVVALSLVAVGRVLMTSRAAGTDPWSGERGSLSRRRSDGTTVNGTTVVALVSVVLGAVIVLAPWFWHRRGLPLTTEMDYFGRVSLSLAIERLPVLAWELSHLAHRMFWEWPIWGLQWWLMLVALVFAPRRAVSAAQLLLLLDVVGSLLSLMVAGMLAPAQLNEHIGGSSPRFLMQLVPVAVLFAAGQLAPRREPRGTVGRAGESTC